MRKSNELRMNKTILHHHLMQQNRWISHKKRLDFTNPWFIKEIGWLVVVMNGRQLRQMLSCSGGREGRAEMGKTHSKTMETEIVNIKKMLKTKKNVNACTWCASHPWICLMRQAFDAHIKIGMHQPFVFYACKGLMCMVHIASSNTCKHKVKRQLGSRKFKKLQEV